jgi:hypothetical protein
MQHLDVTSETIATTLCLWIGGGVVSNSSLFSSKLVFARRDRVDSCVIPLVELEMRQAGAE